MTQPIAFTLGSLALLLSTFLAQASTPITIETAKRAEVLKTPFGTYAPTDKAGDVMLLLQVRGISPEEFDRIATDQRLVLAGERRCELLYTLHFETGEREMAFAVPRGQLKLQLVLGERPRTPIQPDVNILKEIVSPLRRSAIPGPKEDS